jgi:hypothetical protein
MFRSTTFASLTILSALVAAPATVLAQAPMNGTSLAHVGDVLGGGGASISGGGGDDRTITYSRSGAGGGASYAQPGRIATFAGNSGGSPSWTYAAVPGPRGVGREAQLVGGGEDAQVVYIDPTGTRQR